MDYRMIEELLEADSAELFWAIGSDLADQELGARPLSGREKTRKGETWFSEERERLQHQICNSNVVSVYLKSARKQDRVLLVAAIADLIASIVSGVAAFSVAVLIVREGLITFCEGYDDNGV